YSGKACAEVDGRHVTELQPGHFIGSISYVTEETAPANVVAIEPTSYVSWPKSKLKDFMNKNPDLHSALKSTLAIDLTRWLQATWARGTSQNATRTDPVWRRQGMCLVAFQPRHAWSHQPIRPADQDRPLLPRTAGRGNREVPGRSSLQRTSG